MKTRRDFVLDGARGLAALGYASLAMSEGTRKTTGFVYDEIYLKHVIRPDHVESPTRLRRILEEMKAQGLDTEVTKVERMREPLPHIASFHQRQHVARVRSIPTTGDVAEAAVGGALAAVKAVSDKTVPNAFCAIRPPGHHAHNAGEEEGFCYYSNAAI